MAEPLRQYFRIALLAGRPQDLPGGSTQMYAGIAFATITYLLALSNLHGISLSIAHVIIDLGGTAIALRIALAVVGHPRRFEQAFGGLCGASAFVNLAAIPVYAGRSLDDVATVSAAGALAGFALLVWSLSLLAHVIRHTFELKLAASIGIAFVWFVVLLGVMDGMLPPVEVPPATEALDAAAAAPPLAVI